MLKEEIFWEWFKKNKSKFSNIDTVNEEQLEKLLDEFLYHLHIYNNNLFFQIGSEDSCNELVISAEGNQKYFIDVERLVNSAPNIKDWKVIAFKPPMGVDFITEYKGIKLNPKEMWFLPLDNEKKPAEFGLKICVSNFNKKQENKLIAGVCQVLDTILGEKSFALDVQYIEVAQLPTNPKENNLIELTEISEYINWIKNK